jgi:hypothetical protein
VTGRLYNLQGDFVMFAGSRYVAGLALGLILLAAPAAAEPASAPPPAATANPQAAALVRRYLAAIHFERNMDAMQAAMLPVIVEQARRTHPNLTAEDQQMLVDVVRRVMREKMLPKMIDRMVPIYAATFTIPELEAMVNFYESPVGRSIADKTPSLAPQSAEVTRALMPEMMGEVVKEIVARICPGGKCDAAKPPKAAAS